MVCQMVLMLVWGHKIVFQCVYVTIFFSDVVSHSLPDGGAVSVSLPSFPFYDSP